jgi:protein SCO1/2
MVVTVKSWHMTKKDRNSDQGGAQMPRGLSRKRVPVILAILLFLSLATGVFVVSEKHAQKALMGFPNFADSPFVLTDQNGDLRSNADFAGQPIALFFGFTYCPDVCPTTLMSLANSLDALGDDGVDVDGLQIIFVSVDAERDTPQQMRDYLTLFEMDVVGLTGNTQALADSRAAFGAFAQKIEGEDGDFTYDHSAAVYLYDQDGGFAGTIVFNEPEEFIREKLRRLLS